jgi:hypothetical protein
MRSARPRPDTELGGMRIERRYRDAGLAEAQRTLIIATRDIQR